MDTDVVITHGPPKYHCDETQRGRSVGCEVLRQTLWRVRPRLNICGHIHEARGAERILWDLHGSNVKYNELNTKPWIDPGQDNKKQSLIDLTARGGAALDYETTGANESTPVTEQHPQSDSSTVLLPSSIEGAVSYPRGHGGIPPSDRCDMEALSGRMGRKETWVINAAIKASSWPPTSGATKLFNKPIVVDIDLPVWRAAADDI